MLRKNLLRLRDEERGIALVIALGVTVVLSIAMASAIDYSSSNSRNASVSDKQNGAYSLAEAGVNMESQQPAPTVSAPGLLAGKTRKVATLEEISEAAATGWAGQK